MSNCNCQQQATPAAQQAATLALPLPAANAASVHIPVPANAHVVMLSGSISATYNAQTNQICLNLPIVGSECISSPVHLPADAALTASFQTCNSWWIPVGVRVSISFMGNVIWSGSFGDC